jgi:hypothetical protein
MSTFLFLMGSAMVGDALQAKLRVGKLGKSCCGEFFSVCSRCVERLRTLVCGAWILALDFTTFGRRTTNYYAKSSPDR